MHSVLQQIAQFEQVEIVLVEGRKTIAHFTEGLIELINTSLLLAYLLYLLALRDLLKYTMQDQYDNIGWWLYEAPDAGYTVSWEEAGKEVSVDLTEAGALYVKKSGCEFLIYKQNDEI